MELSQIVERIRSLHQKIPFFFCLPESYLSDSSESSELHTEAKYFDKNFISHFESYIPSKISTFILNSVSPAEYVTKFVKVSEKYGSQEISTLSSCHQDGLNFFVGGRLHSGKQINPLVDKIELRQHEVEIRYAEFGPYIEQRFINFLIEHVILTSIVQKENRRLYVDEKYRKFVTTVERNTGSKFSELEKKTFRKQAQLKALDIFPVGWDIFSQKSLWKNIFQNMHSLDIALQVEPYLGTTEFYFNCMKGTKLGIDNKFFSSSKHKNPSKSVRELCRTILLLQTFAPEIFENRNKLPSRLAAALIQSGILKHPMLESSMRTNFYLTCRNSLEIQSN